MCKFINYVMAGYPLLWVKTHEEFRVLTQYVSSTQALAVENQDGYGSYSWDIADGIKQLSIKNGVLATGTSIEGTENDPMQPLLWLDEKAPDNTVLYLKDYTPFLEKSFQDSVLLIRKIRNLISEFKSQGKVLVILSPEVKIPIELDKELHVIDFKLPNRDDLRLVLKGICKSSEAPYPDCDDAVIDGALGMTAFEAENAFSISLIEAKCFDAKLIRREKSAIVRKTGLLEIVDSPFTLDDIGGLENLKSWLVTRKESATKEARQFGVKPPKGMLLVGVPGCGKSLTAKAIAAAWGRPLLRLDIGRIFGSYVGESESNMRRCLEIADAVSPVILWIDEAEKGLSGNKASMDSHETTKRTFQQLLTWMQEKTSDVFVFLTANSVESLPPELLRPGRIDVTFWVDLPDSVQREEIFKIHLGKFGRKPDMFKDKMPELMKACEGFSGAEIEVWIQEAIVVAFHAKHSNVELSDLLSQAKDITPIAKLMKNDIDKARKWAVDRGTKNASATHDEPASSDGSSKPRKVQLI